MQLTFLSFWMVFKPRLTVSGELQKGRGGGLEGEAEKLTRKA